MNFTKINIGKVSDFKPGEMKAVSVGEDKEILIINNGSGISALGAHCTHYGAPLEKGILNGDTIICPWHHACFNSKTGNLKEPPALESLPSFEVEIENEKIFVKIPSELPASRTPAMVKKDPNVLENYIIIGGGAAGYSAAQALREAGYKGKITIITQENRTPYDRPNLSKDYLQGSAQDEWMPLRSDDFYKDYGIDFMFNMKIIRVQIKEKKISFEKGGEMYFDKLLIATGGIPRRLDITGSSLKNIFYLRSFSDSDAIIRASKHAETAVIIGSSFIGMETAFSLRKRGLSITVLSPDEVPFEKTLGKELGKLFKSQHEDHGTNFKMKAKAESFEGKEKVETVVLENGERIKTDLVIVGIGVKPATDFIEDLHKREDGGILVDKFFSADDNVYAAGDIAVFKNWHTGEEIRIEHWRTSLQEGRTAGFSMAGQEIQYENVPFFWTTQADLNLRYVGYAIKWDEIIYWGTVQSKQFIAFYVKDHKVIAAAGNNKDKEMAAIHMLMRLNKMPSADKLKNKDIDLISLSMNK